MKTRLAWSLAISIILLPLVLWTAKQRPRLSLNAQQFGLMLTQPRYRSWFLSFCDGYTVDERGRFHAVNWHWPKFSHVDMAWLNLTNDTRLMRDVATNLVTLTNGPITNRYEITKQYLTNAVIITNQSSGVVPLTVNAASGGTNLGKEFLEVAHDYFHTGLLLGAQMFMRGATIADYDQCKEWLASGHPEKLAEWMNEHPQGFGTNVWKVNYLGSSIISLVSYSPTNFVIETPFVLINATNGIEGHNTWEFGISRPHAPETPIEWPKQKEGKP